MIFADAKSKAVFAVSGLSVLGAIALLSVRDPYISLPLIVFYGVTVVNAYFSIKCFASITPKNNLQNFMDALLIVLYLALLLFLNDIENFMIIAALLFTAAPMKYAFLLKIADDRHSELIRRKIFLDNLGIAACILALVGAIKGYGMISVYALAAVFVVANIYLLVIRPFYRLN